MRVWPEELEERTVEMFDAALFVAMAASFHPGKTNKVDFFLMCVASTPFSRRASMF